MTDNQSYDDSFGKGALSAAYLVNLMLNDNNIFGKIGLHNQIEPVFTTCMKALEDVRARTKRGRKPEFVYRLLLTRLVGAMRKYGIEVKAPSNDNVHGYSHPTFELLITALNFEKGKMAVAASELDNSEKEDAMRIISRCYKLERAVVHFFHDATVK